MHFEPAVLPLLYALYLDASSASYTLYLIRATELPQRVCRRLDRVAAVPSGSRL